MQRPKTRHRGWWVHALLAATILAGAVCVFARVIAFFAFPGR